MSRRLHPKLIGVWLVSGIILPGIFSFSIQEKLLKDHGVLVAKGNSGSWYEASIQDGLNRLTTPETEIVEISTYLWSKKRTTYLVVFKGKRKCELLIDNHLLFGKDDKPIGAGVIEIPQGFSFLQLRLQPSDKNTRDLMTLLWSSNFSVAKEVPARQSFNHKISEEKVLYERMARVTGIIARVDGVLLALWILLQVGRFPLFNRQQSPVQTRVVVLAFLIMAGLRFAGLGYQMEEGLHPDEKLYGGMIQQVRTGELAPTQFWYTTGYFFVTASAQRFAEWIVGDPLPQNLIQRSISAICSSLTCLLVFSVARLFFSFEAAILAMLFFGFAFMPVELAHYGIVEPTMVFFFFLAFAALVSLSEEPSIKGFAKAGLFAGVAVAIKQTAALIALPFLITWIFLWKQKMLSRTGLLEMAAWVGCAFVGFLILSPATILDFARFYQYQVLQARSLEGESATHLFFVDHNYFGELAWKGLHAGFGYPLIIASIAGLFFVWKKSEKAGWFLVPAALAYLLLISKVTAVPEHYVLLLCPFVALLAAATVSSISEIKSRFRPWLVPVSVLLLLVPSLKDTFRFEKLIQRIDTRRQATEWCYKNLPAGIKIDYDTFGPRFLIPIFDTSKLRLFERPTLEHYLSVRRPDFFVQDSLTSNIFLESPKQFFPRERHWYESLNQYGEVRIEFRGEKFRLLNPDVHIYRFRPRSAPKTPH